MPLENLEFFPDHWIDLPSGIDAVRFRLRAKPPVVATIGVTLWSKKTVQAHGSPMNWKELTQVKIDNSADTAEKSSVDMIVSPGMDYNIRFEGSGVLVMLGFNSIELGFDLVSFLPGKKTISDAGGLQTANGKACFVRGMLFLRYPNAD